MMYIKDGGVIQLTRGDTARLSITIENEQTNAPYQMEAGDTLRMTVRKSVHDESPAIELQSTGAATFHLRPEDTSQLSFGKYLYDVELTTASGDVYTVIEPTTFELLREVTHP